MKTAVVFLLLLATVFCYPVKRSASSSESSEEQAKPARSPVKPFQSQVKFVLPQLKVAAGVPQKAPTQSMTAESDESSDSSDEAQESDTASDSDANEEDNDTDESSESNESEDAETTTTVAPPPEETTFPPIIDNGRGDSLGSPRDYKSNIFVESNKIEKGPSPYKYYEGKKVEDGLNLVSKKSSIYDGKMGNDIEKSLKVYKAIQVNEEPQDEDTSTPEVESQGLDPSSGAAEGVQGPAQTQGEESTEEAEAASATSESDSASAADGSDSSQSSEEATATPGAADADSSQSSESQESDSAEAETTTEPPVVITAK